MAKGFDKSVAKKKPKKYGVLSKDLKSFIKILEQLTDCVYGEDFSLDPRSNEIYGTRRFVRIVQKLQSDFKDIEEISDEELDTKSEEELSEELNLESEEELNEELDEDVDSSMTEILQRMIERTLVVDDPEEGRSAFLFTEALVFKAYKLLHNGDEPIIENSLCVYPHELDTVLDKKMDELLKSHDFENKREDFIDEVMSDFIKFLKKHNYHI